MVPHTSASRSASASQLWGRSASVFSSTLCPLLTLRLTHSKFFMSLTTPAPFKQVLHVENTCSPTNKLSEMLFLPQSFSLTVMKSADFGHTDCALKLPSIHPPGPGHKMLSTWTPKTLCSFKSVQLYSFSWLCVLCCYICVQINMKFLEDSDYVSPSPERIEIS